MFGGFGENYYLCRRINQLNIHNMNPLKYIITGVNRLTGLRDQLSRPMTEEEAQQRLQREQASRKYQRYQPHTKLKVERLEARQLRIQFNEDDL